MTTQEKKDRRVARHEVEAALKSIANRKLGLYSTSNQLRAGKKVLVDRYFAEQINPAAERIEEHILSQAKQRAGQ